MKGSWGMVIRGERIVSAGMRKRSRLSIVMVPESRSRTERRIERTLQAQYNCLDIGDELGNCTVALKALSIVR